MCDTDRLNRSLRLGLTFDERREADGTLVRIGSIRKFGLTIRWEERDFTFVAPERFSQERKYLSGPVSTSSLACRIEPTDTGCSVHYTLTIVPRSFLVRPVVAAETSLTTKPSFDRSMRELEKLLTGQSHSYDPPPPPIGREATERLESGTSDLFPRVAEALRQRILRAPLTDQARIRPLEMARELELAEDEVVAEFLRAVQAGVLEMSWEILCPSCQAPKAGSETLRMDLETHCVACDVRYDATFPDSVDVVFRPHPAIRSTDVEVACLLSPARTPHVVAKEEVRPGDTHRFVLELGVGGHRIDTDPWFGGASLEVEAGVRSGQLTADLTSEGLRPTTFRVRPGRVLIALRNRTDEPLTAIVQKIRRPPFTLTAGRLLQLPKAAELLPPEAVAPGLTMHAGVGVVVALARFSGPKGDAVHLRVYADEAGAQAFLATWDGAVDVGLGVARGPVTTLVDGDRTSYVGKAVDRAVQLLRTAGGGRMRLDASVELSLEGTFDDGDGYRDLRLRVLDDRRAEAFQVEAETRGPERQQLGPYVVDEELGRGGMGRVFAAKAPDGRDVVVKTLLPALAADPEHTQRFYDEARISHGIQHPNVVRVLDWGTAATGEVYLVMERIEGRELEERLCEGTLSVEESRSIGVQVLRALHAAHDAGVVHRDIKPPNILLGPDGHVTVIDFGIAHPIGEKDALAERGIVVGSPRYMSPEQVMRRPLDGRSDLYSVAVVVFECITGEVPFDGDGARAQAMARVYGEPKSFEQRGASEVPRSVRKVVERALQGDVTERFSDAVSMAEALSGED